MIMFYVFRLAKQDGFATRERISTVASNMSGVEEGTGEHTPAIIKQGVLQKRGEYYFFLCSCRFPYQSYKIEANGLTK